MSVIEYYESALKERGFQPDAAQRRTIECLQLLHDELLVRENGGGSLFGKWFGSPKQQPKGIYLWGGVGRGKSFLMDCFFSVVPVTRKVRLHFHEFMRGVHEELILSKGLKDPLNDVANRVAKKYRLICFDEFHVSDIADAMILYRLLDQLFAHGVVFVMTSNYEPKRLYPDGLHRDRLLPAIDLIYSHSNVLQVDVGVDYRLRTLEKLDTYLSPIRHDTNSILNQDFDALTEVDEDEEPKVQIESRQFNAIRRAGSVVWFDFNVLCGGPRSQNDYLELSQLFNTVIVSNVPKMGAGMASEARRFTWLIDVFYDHSVNLILSAEVPAEDLYTDGAMANEFTRTASRIIEMQTKEYLDTPKRTVARL